MFDIADTETRSPTALVLEELQLYGYRPFAGEPDPRPLPDADRLGGALADIFDALVSTFTDTRLEPDLEELLWSVTNIFHRTLARIDRDLDANELTQKRAHAEQDGSEVRAVELETLTCEGVSLLERRAVYQAMREHAADLFETHLGETWRPRAGSATRGRGLTGALIDSRDFLAAKRRVQLEPLLPPGPKIAFAGGAACADVTAVWAALDKVHAKHPQMALLHGGAPKGADKIAAAWADQRQCPQIVFKPDWTTHGKAAPFKRNDQLLAALPIGLVVFPGSGVTENLADKARAMGVPVWRFGGR